MGRQIIKQPNGLYAVWSSVVDNFIGVNCTAQDIIDRFTEEEKERITSSVNETVDLLNQGEKPYYQFTKTWEEALQCIESYHGQDELNKLKEFYAKTKEK